MMRSDYEVEIVPFVHGGTRWSVFVWHGGRIIGRPRHFRYLYFAKRYHDKWKRQLDSLTNY